ncbi:MAG: hypothetical protein KIS62_08600 [Ramlibacter sp.]|nr:hypothetical protein [Ramlibacter sp.]
MTSSTETREQLAAEIDTALSLGDGTKINLSYTILKIIQRADLSDQPVLIRHAAESFENAQSSKEIQIDAFINDTERALLEKKFGKLVDQMLNLIFSDNAPEEKFYANLQALLQNPLFPDEKTRTFAFYFALIDKRLPYFQLTQGLKMSDDDWKQSHRRLSRERAKIRFILNSEFKQRSEEADLLLKEICAQKNYEDQVSLMGYILFERGGARQGLDALMKTIRRS